MKLDSCNEFIMQLINERLKNLKKQEVANKRIEDMLLLILNS